jgi:RNA polymerase sigma-70 factor (ECF subfamily)
MDQGFSHQLVALLPRLRRFARGLTRSPEEGDDLVQAACERALSRRDQFEPGTRLDSWMYRIVQNIWIDNRRRQKKEVIVLDPAALAERVSSSGASAAEDGLYLAQVRQAIDVLPDEQREVLMLISVEGASYKDAAEILDLPLGTVMSRLSRARLALGRALESPPNRQAGAAIVRIRR